MAPVSIAEVSSAEAAACMARAGLRVALDLDTPERIAEGGACFSLRTERGEGVFVIERVGDALWVSGAGSSAGTGLTQDGLAAFERIARGQGCDSIGFQTVRRGLVRLAQRQGYEVAGYIMKKAVPNGR